VNVFMVFLVSLDGGVTRRHLNYADLSRVRQPVWSNIARRRAVCAGDADKQRLPGRRRFSYAGA
jgi:hypothetical protein